MRPKKKVLILDANELRLSALRFTLWTRGFNPLGAANAQEAAEILDAQIPDLVIAQWPASGFDLGRALSAVEARAPIAAILLHGRTEEAPALERAIALPRNVPNSELVDQVRTLAARKRGPAKGTPRKPVEAVDADALARRLA